MNSRGILYKEFIEQKECIKKTKTVILYGNSIIACIMKIVISEMGFNLKCRVFDRGVFIDEADSCSIDFLSKGSVIILCSSRAQTRWGMKKDAERYFVSPKCYDFYALYYEWITDIIKRECDYDEFADTLIMCREEKCFANIDSINTLFCNLSCKECSNGIQYRRTKKVISADSQVFHLEKITNVLPINQCNFQGGGGICGCEVFGVYEKTFT